MDALNSDQKTLNGGTLTYYRKFRKNWLDYAIIGLKSEGPSKSSNWPADVQCDNASSTPSTRSSCPAPTTARGKRDARCRRGGLPPGRRFGGASRAPMFKVSLSSKK